MIEASLPENSKNQPPSLSDWLPIDSIKDGGFLAGKVGEEKIIVCRVGQELFAYSAFCSHLGAPLDEGLLADGALRCPWHHARFDVTTGAAICAPAFDRLAAYRIEKRGKDFCVRERLTGHDPARKSRGKGSPIVIVGGGAAGFSAADALRREGWDGEAILYSEEREQPYDRTLLTKDYLDGSFGDDRLGIAQHDLASLDVKFEGGVGANSLDARNKTIQLGDGRSQSYRKVLLATGAAPVELKAPGADLPHILLLRSLEDCRRIIAKLFDARRVAVVGGSFIALEAAASLRSRGLDVEVIAPELHPLEKIFGRELSDLVVHTHRAKGVALTLGAKVAHIDARYLTLEDGRKVQADLVLVGVGVAPRLDLARAAGLLIDRGVTVNARLQTSAPDVYAAGDIARWPDPLTGESIRVEHWVVAERQGQVAAANMLGADRAFDIAPFFWTKHFDLSIHYLGHAERWDEVVVDGDVAERDATVHFRKRGRRLAIATVGRDMATLRAELDWETRKGAGLVIAA
jgi:apoptosis-inducing factor 3